MAQMLITKGAKIEAKDGWGATPLYLAASSGQISTLGMLLKNGANIEAENDFSKRPLHAAILNYDDSECFGSDKIVEILLQKGATLDAKNWFNDTPLHLAVKIRGQSKVEMLVKSGASLNIRQNLGWTPLECALSDDPDLKCFKVLLYNEGLM